MVCCWGLQKLLSFAAAGFLDNVCTDIIHYEDKKLVHYPGNLSEFVKAGCPTLQGSQVTLLIRPSYAA